MREGKTSLIKKLVGDELKWEPERRVQAELEADWRQLEKQWLSALAQHERHLDEQVETCRLQCLLSSQLDLQQLLIDQQKRPRPQSQTALVKVKSEIPSVPTTKQSPQKEPPPKSGQSAINWPSPSSSTAQPPLAEPLSQPAAPLPSPLSLPNGSAAGRSMDVAGDSIRLDANHAPTEASQPSDLQVTATTSSSPKVIGVPNGVQSAELSTQAKVINILFTQTVVEPAGSGQLQCASSTGNKQKLLVPSRLLRQYQRRLSGNFRPHASDQTSMPTGVERVAQDTTAAQISARDAARAAASLARVAASAAQALIVQQQRQVATSGGRAGSPPPDRPTQRATRELTASGGDLASAYREQLRRVGVRFAPSGRPAAFPAQTSPPSQSIKHFSMSFVDKMQLYELKIIDMPSIEPSQFPTSSLLEWSLFKGRSHLLTADAYLLVFDLTRPSTIQYIKQLRDKIFESRKMSQVPVYVIANKADLCSTMQPSLQARQLRKLEVRRHQQQALLAGNSQQQQQVGDPDQSQTNASPTRLANHFRAPHRLPRYPTAIPSWMAADSSSGRSLAALNAARHLLTGFRERHFRMRADSLSGRFWRRWPRVRVNRGARTGGKERPSDEWLEFRGVTHYSLLVGASAGGAGGLADSGLGRSAHSGWSLGGALGRLRRAISGPLRRLRDCCESPGAAAGAARKRKRRHKLRRRRRRRSLALGLAQEQATPTGVGLAGRLLGRRPQTGADKRKRAHVWGARQRGRLHANPAPSFETGPTQSDSKAAKVEPICGAMATGPARATFYELFNKLLQSSSLTAARSQLAPSVSGGGDGGGGSGGTTSTAATDVGSSQQTGAKTTAFCSQPPAPPSNPNIRVAPPSDKQQSPRRRSSGTALWQALSNYTMGGRSSPGRQSIGKPAQRPLPVQEETADVNEEPNAPSGVHLGADQYLSVDMLRKLSLISATSQLDQSAGATKPPNETEAESATRLQTANLDGGNREQPNRKSTANLLQVDDGSQMKGSTCAEDAHQRTTSAPGSGKRIWYRGMVKKILFHSNKQSLKGLVTAMELQRRADQLGGGGGRRSTLGPPESTMSAQVAPSIRIITSGSSLSILSGTPAQTALPSSPTGDQSSEVGPPKWSTAGDAQLNVNELTRANKAPESGHQTNSSSCEQVCQNSGGQCKDNSANEEEPLSSSAACQRSVTVESSLSSLASVSLQSCLADQQQAVASGCGSTEEPDDDDDDDDDDDEDEDDGEEADDEADEEARRRLVHSAMEAAGNVEQDLLGSALNCSLRKLSADDCLIINRQRRKSLAALANGDQPPLVTDGVSGSSQAGSGGQPATTAGDCQLQVVGKQHQGCLQQHQANQDERRQSIKASIEAAVHLLVPRAKGTRSASITLGAADCEQRPRSQLGVSIVGAVGVHRTWRDWRQLLGKRKSTQQQQQLQQQSKSVAGALQAGELPTRACPEGAPAGFDQLMRINQLALSAANALMMAQPNSAATTADSGSVPLAIEPVQQEVEAEVLKRPELVETEVESGFGRRQRPLSRRGHLMKRLQQGGNLLLKRQTSFRAQMKALRGQQQQPLTGVRGSTGDELTFSAMLAREHAISMQAAQLRQLETLKQVADEHSSRKHESGASKQTGPTAPSLDDSNLSAQIAAAAANALERQKDRCERISAIIEPRYDKKQPGAQYPLFASHDLNPILKDLAQLVRKHWHCNYIECSASSNWNIRPIISELTRTLECNNLLPSSTDMCDLDQPEVDWLSSRSSSVLSWAHDMSSSASSSSRCSTGSSAAERVSPTRSEAPSDLSAEMARARQRIPSMLVQPAEPNEAEPVLLLDGQRRRCAKAQRPRSSARTTDCCIM